MKKKILFIMSSLRSGGAERSLVNLLCLFDFKKYDVDLLLFQQEGFFLTQLPDEVKLISDCEDLHVLYENSLNKIFSFKHPILSIMHVICTIISKAAAGGGSKSRQYRWKKFYKNKIKEIKGHYDIGIAYMHCEPVYFLADKVKADMKIGWIHNDYSQIAHDKSMDLEYFKKINKIISISDICVEVLKKTFPSQADKIYMLPNLTSSQSVHKLADEFMPEVFNTKKIKLLSVGRLEEQKGFDIAVKAAAILKKRGMDFIWIVLGNGRLKKELENQIKQSALESCFFLAGTKKNPYPFMKNADIIVQTSRFEGKSVVIDEAKILAKPIVVTRYPTVYDQIDENEGIITELNAQSVADGIESMLINKQKYIDWLSKRNYGNQDEINKYYEIFKGSNI